MWHIIVIILKINSYSNGKSIKEQWQSTHFLFLNSWNRFIFTTTKTFYQKNFSYFSSNWLQCERKCLLLESQLALALITLLYFVIGKWTRSGHSHCYLWDCLWILFFIHFYSLPISIKQCILAICMCTVSKSCSKTFRRIPHSSLCVEKGTLTLEKIYMILVHH